MEKLLQHNETLRKKVNVLHNQARRQNAKITELKELLEDLTK
mgnify:CR=1 FL=1